MDTNRNNKGNDKSNISERSTRSRAARNKQNFSYKEPNESDSDFLEQEESEEEFSEQAVTEVSSRSEVSSRKPKGKEKYKMVPYTPVHIPFGFGDKEVESLLAYRERDGQEEALVKYKHMSYHHVEWLSREFIETKLPQGKHRFKKLKQSYEYDEEEDNDEYFNPTFLEIDRVLDEGEITDEDEPDGLCVYGLVKWEGLPYEEATWEKLSKIKELNNDKFEELIARSEHPGDHVQANAPRPSRHTFKKLEKSPYFKGGNQLRDYQLEGLNWLNYCYYHGQSSIMADEMGLGKTIQSVAFINHVYNTCKIRGPFLVVAPLSTLPHWEREFRSWTDLNAVVYHGSATSRNLIVDTEFYYKDEFGLRLSDLYKVEVVITTYEMTLAGAAQLSKIKWRVGVFDEAHRLKNRQSKVLEGLRNYSIEHRVLLTGTPLQNSVSELFSLLSFLEPQRFNDEAVFLKEFGDLKSSEEVAELQALLKPLMLRRFKEDVEKSIPSKEETVIEVELTNYQKTWYRAILEKNFSFIKLGGKGTGPSLNNIMMELRKCCNHPFLIKGAEEMILKEQESKGSQPYIQTLIESSGKFVLLDKLLPKLKEAGHKVLIFSQMTKVLDIIAEYLQSRNYEMERIDGGVKSQDRQMAIDRFSTSPDSFTFLLCTRAGGVGINLTAADTVIIFDSDWNPQNDLQAQARVHRIGQKNSVKIYRLLCANTYERQMFDRANLKLGLDKAVMQKMDGSYSDGNASNNSGLTKKEIDDLLKLGAYGALLDDTESAKFCEEDIDSILERRSTVINYNGNAKGTVFSKASFTSFDGDQTDLNDPLFWDKWAAKADLDPTKLEASNPLIIDEKRIRKRTKRFEYVDHLTPKANVDEESDGDFPEDSRKGPRVWTASGRALLERKLMIYGLSNWEKLSSSFTRRSLKDLRACVHHLVRTVLKITRDSFPDSKRAIEDVESALSLDQTNFGEEGLDFAHLHDELHIPYPDADKVQIAEFRSFLLEAPSDYLDRIQAKAKSLLQRIQVIYVISEKIVPRDPEELQRFEFSYGGNAGLPATWWTPQMDRDLLIGITRYGYHQYDELKKDPELVFNTLNFSSPRGTGSVSPLPLNAEDETQNPSLEPIQEVQKELKEEPDAQLILESKEDLNEDDKEGEEGEDKLDEEEGDMAEDSNQEKLSWPPGVELGLRIRRLVTMFNKASVKASSAKAKREAEPKSYVNFYDRMILALQNNADLSEDYEMDSTWSAKEIKNFLKTISSFGIETTTSSLYDRTWTRFRLLSDLYSKEDADLENALSQYIRMCHETLQDPNSSSVADRNPHVVKFVENLMPTLKPNVTRLNFEVPTPEKAKRSMKRVMQMHELRHRVVHSTNLRSILAQSRRPQGFPDWWNGTHDEALLDGLILYGTAREDLLLRDQRLPFYEIEPSTWPKEILIIRHIDQLLDIAHKLNNIHDNQKKIVSDFLKVKKRNQNSIQFTLNTQLQTRDKKQQKHSPNPQSNSSNQKIDSIAAANETANEFLKSKKRSKPIESTITYQEQTRESSTNLQIVTQTQADISDPINESKDIDSSKEPKIIIENLPYATSTNQQTFSFDQQYENNNNTQKSYVQPQSNYEKRAPLLVYDSKDGPVILPHRPIIARNEPPQSSSTVPPQAYSQPPFPSRNNTRPSAIVKLSNEDSQPKITHYFGPSHTSNAASILQNRRSPMISPRSSPKLRVNNMEHHRTRLRVGMSNSQSPSSSTLAPLSNLEKFREGGSLKPGPWSHLKPSPHEMNAIELNKGLNDGLIKPKTESDGYNPTKNRMFTMAKGQGQVLNQDPIHSREHVYDMELKLDKKDERAYDNVQYHGNSNANGGYQQHTYPHLVPIQPRPQPHLIPAPNEPITPLPPSKPHRLDHLLNPEVENDKENEYKRH